MNNLKSEEENNRIASSIFLKANSRNYNSKIDEFNRVSPFDYNKADTLVDTFGRIASNINGGKVGAVIAPNMLSNNSKNNISNDSLNYSK